MAKEGNIVFSASVSRRVVSVLLFVSSALGQNIVVFQPSLLTATGPAVTAYLLGNTSGVSLNLRTVSPSNTTGSIGSPSCAEEATRWVLTAEQIGKVSACVGSTPHASLLIRASIHARLFPANAGADNKTVIANQVYQPLGVCPCDLTFRVCDVRCCCDQDCSSDDLKLFASHCLPGPFGGQVSPAPDYQCSVQSSENAPDWFPFLCVNSPPENNPYLGFFYQGDTIASSPGPSFQTPVLSAPEPVSLYIQGSPIITKNGQYFTIPQMILGHCTNNAPAAFLKNFQVECVTLLSSCPNGSPFQTQPTDLSTEIMNGQGGVVVVNVTDVEVPDLSLFISESGAVDSTSEGLVCQNVTLALDYKFFWTGNSLTGVTLTHTAGSIISNGSVALTARYSAVFLNREFMPETKSGNPGYQVGKPVIAGVVGNNTEAIQKTSINVWKPVLDGLCSTAQMKPVLFGENSTSGCLLAASQQNLTECNLLREMVTSLQETLIAATYVAKNGNPDLSTMTDWVNISFVTLNSSAAVGDVSGACSGIPSHQHIQVWTLTTGLIDGVPQREIRALEVRYGLSAWTLNCGGGDVPSCENLEEPQLFPITSTVTFIDIPVNTGPPKSRFRINFTEYDCNRNDVCWPELAFPFTKYYTGEPYSQSLAKGMILVFMFITASILGTPWRQIRQAWHNAAL
ncbi:tectonic-2 isoform X2 [Kryptolebias marmoratus]|uniref:tectonic-2 isoform X2 n=1 Tax=Kryptolebias marmoratus TaxID=37003 RepID=UPI0018ACCAB5|nr:tectonic-2 isoform X2 [Kryptolebias marmoratus]